MIERTEALRWLREENEAALDDLYLRADAVRRNSVGDAVHFRGLIEISNICVRYCHYCGIRAPNSLITRYRMPADEIIECARQAKAFGYGTVVIQAGEDPGITKDWMTAIIRRIKAETGLAVTLSLGERTDEELTEWRNAGADRYLLRFETSNKALFRAIHPPRDGTEPIDRVELLKKLRGLGYEIGSGVMIGIPGQSYDDLANDLMQFQTLDLDMIGVGPYIPHPETPMG
ncbi:MAG: radical SAM protein [Planctomycetota bacterium]